MEVQGEMMVETPFYVTFAQQTLHDLADIYESRSYFTPILFIHSSSTEIASPNGAYLRLASLGEFEQAEWPKVIRDLTARAESQMWGLATEVSMRYRSATNEVDSPTAEEWLIYVLSHQGGMQAWGAPIGDDRRVGEIRELTDDPRLQKMLSHLSEAASSPTN